LFDIEFTAKAEKQLYKLEKDNQIRIISALERIRIRPLSYVKKLVSSDYFRLKIGKYRVILNIKTNKLIIYVIELGHRRNIYKASKSLS
jgi:mRNA interferase RelE/StbE